MGKKSAKKFSGTTEENPLKAIMLGALKGYAVSAVLFIVLLFVGSAVAMRTKDPDSLCSYFGYGICILSLVISGLISARLVETDFLAASVMSGCAFALTAFIVSLFLENSSQSQSSFLFLVYPLFALLGGFIGKPRQGKKRKFSKR